MMEHFYMNRPTINIMISSDEAKKHVSPHVAHLNPADLEVPEPGDGAGEDGLPPLHHRHVVHGAEELWLKILAKTS